MKLSFVVPCYGSENTIGHVVDDVKKIMEEHTEYDYEIVLVNDCSPDGVWIKIRSMCKEDSRIRGVNLVKNFGQHAALMAGYNICTGDYIVTIDDDGQTPVDQTFILLEKLLEGYDVVYGKYAERKDNGFRKLGTAMNNYMLTHLVGKPKDVHFTSYFIARDYIIQEMCRYKNAFPYIWGLVVRTTKNIANATIEHREREEGESGYTISKLLGLWMNGFTAFSVKPLRISFIVGILFSIAGVFGVIFTVVKKILVPDTAAGYSSLMAVLLIASGLMLFSLGLIGEYVGRIYMCINASPQYVVKEIVNAGTEESEKR